MKSAVCCAMVDWRLFMKICRRSGGTAWFVGRTGPCTFQGEHGWRRMFSLAGFEIVKERPLSRWRNLAHPVSRRFFVIKNRVNPVNPVILSEDSRSCRTRLQDLQDLQDIT